VIPDLAAVEAYHGAVIAAMPEWRGGPDVLFHQQQTLRALADLALDGLRRHQPRRVQTGSKTHGGPPEYGEVCVRCCDSYGPESWPCADALAWWSVLTDVGATYGVTAQ
jgi:hypothetical protein